MTSYFLIGLDCPAIASPVSATYCQVAVSPPGYLSACLHAFLGTEIHLTFSLLFPMFLVQMMLCKHICKHVDFLEKASPLLAHLEQVISYQR